jgi:putative transposase
METAEKHGTHPEVGQACGNQLRPRRPKPGVTWHLDEVFLNINGHRHYLWRVVDQEGNILDILVQHQRDKAAAQTFFRGLRKGDVRLAGNCDR